MATYRVIGEWLVKANSAEEARDAIEDCVARSGVLEADLEDCNAELEEEDDTLDARDVWDGR